MPLISAVSIGIPGTYPRHDRAKQPIADQHHRAFAISNNGGGTFGAYQFSKDLIEPVCMAGLINFHGVLYFSNPATTKGRNHMTLKKSLDQGANWQVETLIYAGASCTMVQILATGWRHVKTCDLPSHPQTPNGNSVMMIVPFLYTACRSSCVLSDRPANEQYYGRRLRAQWAGHSKHDHGDR